MRDWLQKRTIPDAEQRLYDDLRWAGLHWDEGAETICVEPCEASRWLTGDCSLQVRSSVVRTVLTDRYDRRRHAH